MKAILVNLLLFLNKLFPRLSIHQNLETAKQGTSDYYYAEWSEGVRVLDESATALSLVNKRVLDLGSGLGGKTCLYAKAGASRAIGLDIRLASVSQAREMLGVMDVELANRVSYVLADAALIPLESESVDTIISVNVFEHLEDPEAAIHECARILDKGGRLLLRFSPWYSPWGPHLNRWINVPWPHLFFSEEVLIMAANAIEEREHLNDGLIETAKMDLRGMTRLPGLNRLTVAGFNRLIENTPLEVVESRLLPFGYDFLGSRGWWGTMVTAVLRGLTYVPLVRELVSTKILCILEKA